MLCKYYQPRNADPTDGLRGSGLACSWRTLCGASLAKSPAELDYQILEDEFAAKQAVMQIGKGGGAQQRPKQALLLPLQRAQNVGVFLTRLKMGPAQVRQLQLCVCSKPFCGYSRHEAIL